jgi:murein DD-endopeptidase MepM/ murein hydrolase activator NlpD
MLLLKILAGFSLIFTPFALLEGEENASWLNTAGIKYSWPLDTEIHILRQFQLFEYSWMGGHTGIDVRAIIGSNVRSPANGRVWFAGSVAGREVLTLEIDNFLFSFDSVSPTVTTGEEISEGQIVATVLGKHCGPNCLHIGLRVSGNYLNPLLLFRQIPYSVIHSRNLDF